MSTTMTPIPLAEFFAKIAALIKEQPKYAELITSHIAAKHKIHTLPAFMHTSSLTDDEKRETMREIVRGVAADMQGQPHNLQGKVAGGQAEKPIEAVVMKRIDDIPAYKAEPAAPVPSSTAEAEIPAASTPVKARPSSDDPLTAKFRELIMEILGPIKATGIDEGRVGELIAAALKKRDGDFEAKAKSTSEAMAKMLNDIVSASEKKMAAEFDKKLAEMPAGQGRVLEIKIGSAVNKVEGITHRQFVQVATWCAAGVPVWLWGAAGGGKTTMGEQIAQALGVPFYCVSIDETITVGKLVGFKNLSNGDYVEGLLYRVWKEGGVVLLDEIDTNATAMASLNAMLANDWYTFGNGERVQRHEKFRVIAGANTKGTGATAGYTARVRLDAATLDRFAVIEMAYDWDMVEGVALGKPIKSTAWKPVEPASAKTCELYVNWVKALSQEHGKSVLISPRAALLGVKALRAGVPMDEVAESLVFKLMAADTRSRVLASHPMPTALAAAA